LFWRWYKQPIDNNKLTLKQAYKMGEMNTYKILVQIKNPKGGSENPEGRYERGDVILVAPADKQFSDTEKDIFLVIRMDLTPKQAEILTLALSKDTDQKGEDGRLERESLKRRKFYADLSAIGIADDDEQGREIEDKIFKWDILREKDIL